ncbi:MAG: helical backbone metal receptor [Caldilineales bacterium]|nr:helical backbone metal receptor [Caldilineales bacterium]
MPSVPTQVVVDQMGRTVVAPVWPQRVVSLVPSQTELLLDLGLGDRLVGRTRFCVHPADQVSRVAVVGGTKQINFATVERLQPDLIVGNKEENERETILRLAERYPVWLSDVVTLDDALAMIRQVGRLVGEAERADALAEEVAQRLAALPRVQPPRRVAYLIWRKPWMAAGGHTFINSMLAHCGLVNVFAGPELGRYPQVSLEALAAAQPELVFLSSEPYSFRERHRLELQAALPASTVMLVDGEMFSWYGSRLRLAADYLARLVAEIGALQR